MATIGSNNLDATQWTPLYIQPVTVAGGHTVFGDADPAVALAAGSKVYIKGDSYNTGQVKSESSLVLRQNGANNHTLTSAVAPSSAYNHFMQPKTGTIADLDQRIINMGLTADFVTASASYVKVINLLYAGSNNLADSMTNLFVAYSADGGFLVSVRLQDVTNSLTICESAGFASGGSNQILTLSSFSNIPSGPAIFELQVSTTTAPTMTVHSASLQL